MASASRSVSVTNPDTNERVWFHAGDELPEWADEAITNPDAKATASAVEPTDAPDASVEPAPADGFDPDASIADLVDYVGDDPDRAREVLAAESAKGDDARKTLVAKLEAVASGE